MSSSIGRAPLNHKMGIRYESDGEDMDHESDSEKGSGSDNDSFSNRSESDGSSSDMDLDELDRRRTEGLDTMADLERQFAHLREQFYRERFAIVDSKLYEIRSGRASEYLVPLKQLQENMRIRAEVASVRKQLAQNSAEMQFEAENLAAQQNLQSEQKLLLDGMIDNLENEIKKLEEERNNIDVSSALWGTEVPRRGGSRKKPVSVSGPYIVYMLSDEDILHDLTIIKKALATKR